MGGSASTLLLDEYFATEDARFLDELFACSAGKKLKAFGPRWLADKRAFARGALLAYVDDGCDRPHHRPLVKSLFKTAEEKGDDEVMGHFLVAFDRLLGRKLVSVTRYEWRTGASWTAEQLRSPNHYVPAVGNQKPVQRFSRHTRAYLCRRAFRYFRVIGAQDPARYGRSIRAALALYEDRHLAKPEQLLDAWGLVHALFGEGDVIARRPRGAGMAAGKTLEDLAPAPKFPGAWKGCFDEVFELALNARARTVRGFAMSLLKADYAADLARLPLPRVRLLLRSKDPEVQLFGTELLRTVKGLESLPVRAWLELLALDNAEALVILCELVEKHLRSDRLTLEQAVALACARPTPVAELGLKWAREKGAKSDEALGQIAALTRAENAPVRARGVRWYVEILEASPHATHERVRDLFDARFADVRAEGALVLGRSERFQDDTALWAALAETPYPDVRSFLLRHLASRQKALLADERRHLWATTILAVQRGSRDKRAALRQISDRIARHPNEAGPLVPLLASLLRSVRETERRAALAAVARAAFHAPELRGAIGAAMPELRLDHLEVG
jgi:hypothetical protein